MSNILGPRPNRERNSERQGENREVGECSREELGFPLACFYFVVG